eukprot:1980020-Prymnesium_polylepis.1
MYTVSAQALGQLIVETICLFNAVYRARESAISRADRLALRLLTLEWLHAMKAVHESLSGFHATYKTHQLLAHCDPKSLALLTSEHQSERAHKWLVQLFKEQTNQSGQTFEPQLVTARNRHMMAWLMRLTDPVELEPVTSRAQQFDRSEAQTKALGKFSNPERRAETLQLVVDDHLVVVDMVTTMKVDILLLDTLLVDHGYQHLYWALLVHFAPNGTDCGSVIDLKGAIPTPQQPGLTLDLRFGVHCGQCYIHCTPFSDCNMMLEFEVGDGTRWQGQMVVVAVVKLLDGTRVEVVYVKWLSLPISGLDRQ